jgi:hypothetical protein
VSGQVSQILNIIISNKRAIKGSFKPWDGIIRGDNSTPSTTQARLAVINHSLSIAHSIEVCSVIRALGELIVD